MIAIVPTIVPTVIPARLFQIGGRDIG